MNLPEGRATTSRVHRAPFSNDFDSGKACASQFGTARRFYFIDKDALSGRDAFRVS